MEGASYPVAFFDNQEELIDFVKAGHKDGSVATLQFFGNEEFYESIRKGGDYEFFTELG